MRIAIALVLAGAGCRALPSIPADACGNHVIEANETCDGFARGGVQCRPPGAAFACQLDCAVASDGTRPACPAGWGCSADSICREATGDYTPLGVDIPGNAFSLIASDFDGDGRADVASLEPPSPFGGTTLRVHYLDRDGRLAETWSSKFSLLSVAPLDVNGDARSDVVFANEELGVLLGQSNRTLISETYPTYVLPDARVRLFGAIYSDDIDGSTALLVLSDRDGQLALSYPDAQAGSLRQLDQFAGSLDALAGEPVIGEILEDPQRSPCLELALALRGSESIWVYSVCQIDPDRQRVIFRASPERIELRLPDDAAPIAKGPLLADLNGDGHLDVLAETEDGSYIAYGDGLQLSAAERWRAPVDASAPVDLALPLAAGDINGDGKADLVYPSGFKFSVTDASGLGYANAEKHSGAVWTSALIVDLNDNGLPDVVASSEQGLDIDFFNGTGSDRLHSAVIETERPVMRLAVGDMDGDLITDIAYVEVPSEAPDQTISVAFGNRSGPPGPTVVAAHVPKVQQIGALAYYAAAIQGELFVVNESLAQTSQVDSAVSWLFSTGDRAIVCLVDLSTFQDDGSLDTSSALNAVVGHFQNPAQVDAVVYGVKSSPDGGGLWLLPELGSRAGKLELLNFDFGALHPMAAGLEAMTLPESSLLMAAGDLDGDGLDELVLAAPDEAGDHCLLASARVRSPATTLEPAANLGEPCGPSSQLGLADLDGDAAPEIVILSGAPGSARTLFALWNDGSGHFTAEPEVLADAALGANAFTALSNAPQGHVAGKPVLAFVSQDSVTVLHAAGSPPALGQAGAGLLSAAEGGGHALRSERLEFALNHGTGIAAADVDGDRVGDLIVADGGSVRVLRAALK